MAKIHIEQIDNSLGIILPEDVVSRLQVAAGDQLQLTFPADCIFLSKGEEAPGAGLWIAENLISRYGKVLREIAE